MPKTPKSPRYAFERSPRLALPGRVRRAPTLLFEATTSETPTVMVTCPSWASTLSQVTDGSFAGRSTEDEVSDDDRGSNVSLEEPTSLDVDIEELDLQPHVRTRARHANRHSELSDADTQHDHEHDDAPAADSRQRNPFSRQPSRELPFLNGMGASSPRAGLGQPAPERLARRRSVELSPRGKAFARALTAAAADTAPPAPASMPAFEPATQPRGRLKSVGDRSAHRRHFIAAPLADDEPAPAPTQLSSILGNDIAAELEHGMEMMGVSPRAVHPLEDLTFKRLFALRGDGSLNEAEFEKVRTAYVAYQHPHLLS
ncbi:hypothetical protein KFE25_010776 [Diacronema lutheri]|uniref:Uncharacterized protein n=1 Tax=Diacronema lutheri TaxID=2081491 RepID=A0A8J5X4H4_DIALT|nr:hypothetical protein KFE25_010776 [Diacronema lutheri]